MTDQKPPAGDALLVKLQELKEIFSKEAATPSNTSLIEICEKLAQDRTAEIARLKLQLADSKYAPQAPTGWH
jgi:hypothetical protein